MIFYDVYNSESFITNGRLEIDLRWWDRDANIINEFVNWK